MNNLFATEKKKNYEYAKKPDGAPYITAREEGFSDHLHSSDQGRTVAKEVLRMPLFYVCLGAVLFLELLSDTVENETLSLIFALAALLPVVGVSFLFLYANRKAKQAAASLPPETFEDEDGLTVSKNLRADFPKEALSLDFFFCQYEKKKGKKVICTSPHYQCELWTVTAFRRGDALCLFVDDYYRENYLFTLPTEELRHIVLKKSQVKVSLLQKEIPWEENDASRFGIETVGSESDAIFAFSAYGDVRMEGKNGPFQVWLAPYHVEMLAALLEMPIEEE